MRGSPIYQASQMVNLLTVFGTSKHRAKKAARAAGAKTWHELGRHLGIHSFSTANLYRSVWIEALRYGKETFAVKAITKLSPEIVSSFLEAKISDGLRYGSFNTYCSALEKLSLGLNKWEHQQGNNANYDWTAEIQAAKIEARDVLDRSVETRAYQDPVGLIKAISDPLYLTIAAAQYDIGARISELDHVQPEQFLENKRFEIIKGKGGKDRISEFRQSKPYENYRLLVIENINPNYEKFTFSRNQYRLAIKAAADKSGQPYTGSHGLRWNYAQECFQAIQQNGGTREQALVQVAHAMGHNRGDITEHYLK